MATGIAFLIPIQAQSQPERETAPAPQPAGSQDAETVRIALALPAHLQNRQDSATPAQSTSQHTPPAVQATAGAPASTPVTSTTGTATSPAADTDPNTTTRSTSVPSDQATTKQATDPAASTDPSASEEGRYWQAEVREGEALSLLLARAGVSANTLHALTRAKGHRQLTRLRVGDRLIVHFDRDGQAHTIIRMMDRVRRIVARRTDDGWQIQRDDLPVTTQIHTASGEVFDNLYLAGRRAGMSDKTILALINIYRWKLDFSRQLRRHDTFKVIYEKRYLNGEYIGDGRILAAEIRLRDKVYRAFLATDEQGRTLGYYDENGHNLKKAFLRSPVDYIRITSRFTRKRWHPIHKKWKAHRGVDYGGRIGTPVKATGKGVVKFKGWQRGYGRVVYIQHGKRYTSVYAHLSRFGNIRKGQTVHQGQVIGYIGRSGWATGPHLHYEFRIGGRHVDPLKLQFADAGPLPEKLRPLFEASTKTYLSLLKRLDSDIRLAQKSPNLEQ